MKILQQGIPGRKFVQNEIVALTSHIHPHRMKVDSKMDSLSWLLFLMKTNQWEFHDFKAPRFLILCDDITTSNDCEVVRHV